MLTTSFIYASFIFATQNSFPDTTPKGMHVSHLNREEEADEFYIHQQYATRIIQATNWALMSQAKDKG